jgi:GMP synthase-like glutamine amidotransferase
MRIAILEHNRADGPGNILPWAEQRAHPVLRVRLDEGAPLPALDAFDFLIVMGGPMNIYQYRDFPWLVAEKAFLRTAIAARKPILGICLGAQLLADVLGGKVTQNAEREIGWWPVHFTQRPGPLAAFPAELTVCHWHGDTFTLPPGALHAAASEACANQAFLHGDRIVGLQFHLELGARHVAELAEAFPTDLASARWVQSREVVLAPPINGEALTQALYGLLDRLATLA